MRGSDEKFEVCDATLVDACTHSASFVKTTGKLEALPCTMDVLGSSRVSGFTVDLSLPFDDDDDDGAVLLLSCLALRLASFAVSLSLSLCLLSLPFVLTFCCVFLTEGEEEGAAGLSPLPPACELLAFVAGIVADRQRKKKS